MSPATLPPTRLTPPGIHTPNRRMIRNVRIGDEVTFLRYSTESPQSQPPSFTIRCTVRPGGGVPLHYHRNCSEAFKVLRGELTVVSGDQTLKLGVGEEAVVPVGVNHLFRNDMEGGDMVEFEGVATLAPGIDPTVLLGFQQSLYILYGLANDGLCDEEAKPKSLVDAAVALRLGDFMFAGGLPYRMVMGGMFGMADWIAWWGGREEDLLRRYWD